MLFAKRVRNNGLVALLLCLSMTAAGNRSLATAMILVQLPGDFDARFAKICSDRGLVGPRCDCMIRVVKEQIDDQHLAWMLEYFESGGNSEELDKRMAEYETDQSKLDMLKDEIEQAAELTKKQCLTP